MRREDWTALVLEALRDPRANARRIVGLPLPDAVVWQAVALVSVLAVLGLYGTIVLGGGGLAGPLPGPFAMAGLQVAAMVVLAGVMARAGRMFGGTGQFPGALRLMVWLQALMILAQVVQLVAMLILPPLAGLVSLATLVAIGWVASGLVAGLHGFKSQGITFLGIVGTLLVVGFVLSILLLPFLPDVQGVAP